MEYRTHLEIDIKKYFHNLETIKEVSKSQLIPVVKANAYGHGLVGISKAAQYWGAKILGVAFLEDAITLRKNGITIDILVFNYFYPELVSEFIKYDLIATILGLEQLKRILEILGNDVKKVRFNIHLDTGMNREGVKEEELDGILKLIKRENLNVEGIFSHFATADEFNDFVHYQYDRFKTLLKYFENLSTVKYIHMANSAAALFYKGKFSFDYVRPGIATYGLQPSNVKTFEKLLPILQWKSVVAKVHNLKPGDSVSYGREFIAKENMKIATVPVGYGDGYFRSLTNKGEVIIKGKRAKILGRVCMDQFMVDITHIEENVKEGDEVILIGEQENERILPSDIAKKINTVNYEILTKINPNIPRVYKNFPIE